MSACAAADAMLAEARRNGVSAAHLVLAELRPEGAFRVSGGSRMAGRPSRLLAKQRTNRFLRRVREGMDWEQARVEADLSHRAAFEVLRSLGPEGISALTEAA